MRIVTLTVNPALDVSVNVNRMSAGQKLRTKTPQYHAGGGGINVAEVIHNLGGSVIAVYAAGGATGRMFCELFEQSGVVQHCVWTEGFTRESITVFEEVSGQQYRLVMPGPSLSEQEQEACLDALRGLEPYQYLVISGSLPEGVSSDFYGHAIREAKKINANVILDTKPKTLKEVLDHQSVYLIKPNLRELSELAGSELGTEKDQQRQARDLIDAGRAEVVVVSLGSAGVLLVTARTSERMRAPSVPIRSRVGAGDSMVGGMAFALSEQKPVREAVMYGIAAGSATVMTPGTQLCSRDEVMELVESLA
jgi:6-phosphofructokinase 2